MARPQLVKSRPQLTKTKRLALERLSRTAEALRRFEPMDWDVRDVVPEAWKTLEQDVDVAEKKVKITLRLDESVAKFFRAQGEGYQARINHVLATFAQMKIAQVDLYDRRFAAWEHAYAQGKSDIECL
ncbi:BrnA antitoxin family protein [Celeribacter sp.]|uniref:BrnA antitoxin family protein n=1 Tax=Celeribacter sp. TaxID=1890673 RepID=UPI003A940C40